MNALPAYARRPLSQLRAIAAAAMMGILAACSTPAAAPPDSYYRLDLTTGIAASEHTKFDTLLVDLPRAQGMITERPILYVTQSDPNQVQQYSYQFWESTPPQILHRALIKGLRQAGIAKTVVSPDVRSQYTAELVGRLFKFEQTFTDEGSAAHIQIEIILEDLKSQEIIWVKEFNITQPADDTSLPSMIEAFRKALTQLVNDVVQEMS